MLEEVHGIDSSQFQLVTNHLDIKRISAVPHQNIVFHDLLKQGDLASQISAQNP
jgi:hypothetical protein